MSNETLETPIQTQETPSQTCETSNQAQPYRLYLKEEQIPTHYYNVRADMLEKPEGED